jgi:ectoine hydroxylase
MTGASLTPAHLAHYRERGYVLARGLFDLEEIALLRRGIQEDLAESRDDNGNPIGMADWNEPGDGIYGMFARCERLVNSVELLLGGEAYHYYSRVVMKEARTGVPFPWHQDYAYWYYYGVLRPLLVSAFIAVDPATRANGCLQVIEGSHHCGRLDHHIAGERCADRERVAEILQRMPRVDVEMEPGDALFFHCNLLHCSDPNNSDLSRWSLICVYNAARNDPYCESRHSSYTPLNKVPDQAVKEVGNQRFAELIV